MRDIHHDIPPVRCPYCDYELDTATNADGSGAKPRAGDLTVCLSCAQVLEFDASLAPQKVSDARMTEKGFIDPAKMALLVKCVKAIKKLDRRKLLGGKS